MFCVGDCKHCNLFAARLMIQIGWPLWEITCLKLTFPSNFWGIFSFFKEKTILEFLNLILSLHDLIVSKFRLLFEFDVLQIWEILFHNLFFFFFLNVGTSQRCSFILFFSNRGIYKQFHNQSHIFWIRCPGTLVSCLFPLAESMTSSFLYDHRWSQTRTRSTLPAYASRFWSLIRTRWLLITSSSSFTQQLVGRPLA